MAPDAVEQSPPPSSLVVLELGTRSVSAVLCGVVAGHYRLVSSAEAWHRSSDADVLDAVGRAFRGLEAASERRLLGTHGVVVPMTRDGVGCDLTIVSGGSPLRALVLSFGKAATSFLDGIDPAVADLLPLFAVEDAIEERLGLTGEILSSLREHRPDALILVGSEEVGSFQSTPALAGALTTVHACHPGGLPTVLLAGPAAVRERLVADLRQRVRRGPDSVPPVQQTEPSDLSDHLKRLWQEKWASHPAWRAFAGGGDSPPIPRLTSIGRTCQELSRTRESPVWAIEVGDSDVVAWRATPERVDLVRRSIGQLAPQRNDGELDEWLSRPWLAEVDRASIERQRDLTSRAIGEVAGELRGLGRSEPRPGLVVGRGVGLVHRLPAADAVIAICLGIGLTGPTPVALDRHGLLAGAGLLLERHR